MARRLLPFRLAMSNRIKCRVTRFARLTLLSLLAVAPAARANETLPLLKVGDTIYTNVTITEVTATDIYFSHARGIGNAKLKKLAPELQRHFAFDPTKAGKAEVKQREANAQFRAELIARKPAAPGRTTLDAPPPVNDDAGDIVAPKLHARSIRGQRPPQIATEQWLTPPPDVEGKFVLVEFWATWCGPCQRSIPHLNELQAEFKDRLIVIGLGNESPEAISTLLPRMHYFVGTDTRRRTLEALEVQAIPHAILIDPQGVVRFEGMPGYLTREGLGRLMAKYSN